jgi:hypothetical protein
MGCTQEGNAGGKMLHDQEAEADNNDSQGYCEFRNNVEVGRPKGGIHRVALGSGEH